MTNLLNNLIINCDAPRPWGVYFQDTASPQMEALIELHDNIMFYLVIILFGVAWILVSVIRNYVNDRSFTGENAIYDTEEIIALLAVLTVLLLPYLGYFLDYEGSFDSEYLPEDWCFDLDDITFFSDSPERTYSESMSDDVYERYSSMGEAPDPSRTSMDLTAHRISSNHPVPGTSGVQFALFDNRDPTALTLENHSMSSSIFANVVVDYDGTLLRTRARIMSQSLTENSGEQLQVNLKKSVLDLTGVRDNLFCDNARAGLQPDSVSRSYVKYLVTVDPRFEARG